MGEVTAQLGYRGIPHKGGPELQRQLTCSFGVLPWDTFGRIPVDYSAQLAVGINRVFDAAFLGKVFRGKRYSDESSGDILAHPDFE